MTRTVVGVFPDARAAHDVVRELSAAGVGHGRVRAMDEGAPRGASRTIADDRAAIRDAQLVLLTVDAPVERVDAVARVLLRDGTWIETPPATARRIAQLAGPGSWVELAYGPAETLRLVIEARATVVDLLPLARARGGGPATPDDPAVPYATRDAPGAALEVRDDAPSAATPCAAPPPGPAR